MFPSQRSTRRYCSKSCRQKAYRARVPSAADIHKRIDREMRRLDRLSQRAKARAVILRA
jgi:hypothetical protein